MGFTRGRKVVTDATQRERPTAEQLGIEVPRYLKGVVKTEYLRIAAVLQGANKLHRCDPRLIETYAISYGLMISCHKDLAKTGLTVVNAAGNTVPNPVIRVMNSASIRLAALSHRLGLSERGGVGTVVQMDPENEWDDLLSIGA